MGEGESRKEIGLNGKLRLKRPDSQMSLGVLLESAEGLTCVNCYSQTLLTRGRYGGGRAFRVVAQILLEWFVA